MPGGSAAEYVIKLGVAMDNAGLTQLLNTLDLTKLRAMGLTAAFGALTTGVYKFISAMTQQQFEMEKLAREKKKSIKDTWAEQQALKAMGKTLEEIKKDKALKSIYDDLVKFNKELEMPNAARAYENVRKLQTEFWKLKTAVSYALQNIANQVLVNLEMPMDRTGKKLHGAADWIKNNMASITSKISSAITGFAKGIIGITEAVEKIVGWVGALPTGVKNIGIAIGGVLLLLNSGPLGKIIAAIELVGQVIHDYENFQWNKNNAANPEVWNKPGGGWTNDINEAGPNPTAYQVPIKLSDIWTVVGDDTLSTREKSASIFENILSAISGGLKDAINSLNSGPEGIRNWLSEATGPIGEILGGIVDFCTKNPDQIRGLVVDFVEAAASALTTGGEIGVEVTRSVATMVAAIFGGSDWEDAFKDSEVAKFLEPGNAFATGISTAIETALVGGDFFTSIITGVISGYHEAKKNAIKQMYAEDNGLNIEDVIFGEGGLGYDAIAEGYSGDERLGKYIASGLQDNFNTTISAVIEMLSVGFEFVGNVSSGLLRNILLTIFGDDSVVADALGGISDDNPIFKAISTGLATWIASGDFWVGMFTSLVQLITSAKSMDELNKAADEIANAFITLWEGSIDEKTGEKKGGMRDFFKRILFGEDGDGGISGVLVEIGEKIVEILSPAFQQLGEVLGIALYNALEKSGLRDLASKLGISITDPNTSTIEPQADGTYKVVSTNGRSSIVTKDQALVMAAYGSLGDGKYSFSVNQNGEVVTSGSHTGEHTIWSLMDELKTKAIGTQTVLRDGYVYSNWDEIVRDVYGGDEFSAIYDRAIGNGKISPKPNRKDQDAANLAKSYGEPHFEYFTYDLGLGNGEQNFRIWVNEEGEYEPASFAIKDKPYEGKLYNQDENTQYRIAPEKEYEALVDLFNQRKLPIQTELELPENFSTFVGNLGAMIGTVSIKTALGGDSGEEKAWGGRIGREMNNVTVGEDGTEYIIPITKPERALSLINQMLNEMGSSAINRVMEGLGIGQSGTFGASAAAMDMAMSGMNMTNNYNISAPISINVQSTGADAREIGNNVYDMAERHLIKNVMGVYA